MKDTTLADIYNTIYGRYLFYSDDLIASIMINGHFFEEELLPVFNQNLNKSSVVIEVGSYIGDHTVYISKLVKKVYAFEAQRHIFHQLCANLFLNKCGNVDAKEMVLYNGEKIRLATIERADEYAIPRSEDILTNPLEYDGLNGYRSGIFFKPDPEGNTKSYKLDDVIDLEEKIDMIIVDAEGSDLPILMGAIKIIERYKPIIIFEFNSAVANIHGHTMESYRKFLNDLGYTIMQIGNWNWVARYENSFS